MILRKIRSGFKWIKATYKQEKEFFRQYKDVKKEWKQLKKEEKQYWILAGIPLHGNLGDQAITLAEIKLLEAMDKDKSILEIPVLVLFLHPHFCKKIIGEDKILIHGGGNMGTLWMESEIMLRNVIKIFKKNPIIIFPQSVFFEKGKISEYEKSKEIYSSHKNLHICTREEESYKLAGKMIKKENVHLVPDMVPYLNYNMQHIAEKSGALLCFRNDKEKVLPAEQKEKICKILNKHFGNKIKETDTVIKYGITKDIREKAVLRKIEEFAKAELVITDRLHGMVFAAIAGTPCIALGNCNYKVKGVYQWIKNNDYIRFVEDVSRVEIVIEELLQKKNVVYNNEILYNEYGKLKKIIENA